MQTKKLLRNLITDSLTRAREVGTITFQELPAFDIEAPRQAEHGDFATNAALVLASQAKQSPRRLAEIIQFFNRHEMPLPYLYTK